MRQDGLSKSVEEGLWGHERLFLAIYLNPNEVLIIENMFSLKILIVFRGVQNPISMFFHRILISLHLHAPEVRYGSFYKGWFAYTWCPSHESHLLPINPSMLGSRIEKLEQITLEVSIVDWRDCNLFGELDADCRRWIEQFELQLLCLFRDDGRRFYPWFYPFLAVLDLL